MKVKRASLNISHSKSSKSSSTPKSYPVAAASAKKGGRLSLAVTTTSSISSNGKKPKFEPSTPILFNQNSNSCDTNLSTASSSSASSTSNQLLAQIDQKECKVRSLLKELQNLVKRCHQERCNIEPNLTAIVKTHERIRKEDKSKKKEKRISLEFMSSIPIAIILFKFFLSILTNILCLKNLSISDSSIFWSVKNRNFNKILKSNQVLS